MATNQEKVISLSLLTTFHNKIKAFFATKDSVNQLNEVVLAHEREAASQYIKDVVIEGTTVTLRKGNGTTSTQTTLNTTYPLATEQFDGLMSHSDKIKLDDLENYTLPVAAKDVLGGVKTSSNVTEVTEGLVPAPIIDGIVYYRNAASGSGSGSGSGETGSVDNAIIKGINKVSAAEQPEFSIAYVDAADDKVEIAKLLMNEKGLTIYGDTSTNGVVAATLNANDYSEFRKIYSEDFSKVKPGLVFTECAEENDTIKIAQERLTPIPMVYSDTYGMVIGKEKNGAVPIAVSGRVLVYPFESRDSYQLGDAVCSAPDGKVSKMTRGEIKEYPDRILGYVSCIPKYKVWEDRVDVNDRIWIKLK